MKFRVFYSLNDKTVSISEDEDIIFEEHRGIRDLEHYRYFESMKGYKKTPESLLEFKKDFTQWRNDLLKCDIDYTKYFSSFHATFYTFKRYTTNIMIEKFGGFDKIQNINYVEFDWFEKCNNGALMTINKDYFDIEHQYFGYDFSAYYPNLLSNFDFEFPIKAGKLSKITDFKKKLKYGIYKCKVVCDNKQFNQIFAYSKDNHYTHYSLNFCLKNKTKFDIKLELIDDEFNCLVYDDKYLIKSSEIFKDWFEKLNEIKQQYPKNKLAKHLMSSIIGTLTQFNRVIIHDEEEFENMNVSLLESSDDTEYKLLEMDPVVRNGNLEYDYKLIYSHQPYKYNIARIKSFFSAYSRKYMAEFILNTNTLDNLVRILTDGILFNKEFDFTKLQYYPKPETDKNGLYKLFSITTDSRPK